VSTVAMRDIAAAATPEPRPVTMVRPIKSGPRFESLGGVRTMPLARAKIGGFIDQRRPLVITVEEGRGILSGRAVTAGQGQLRSSRLRSLTTRTNMTSQIVILPVPKVLATIRE